MVMRPILRPIFAAVAATGLLALAWTGIEGSVPQLMQRNTVLQTIQVVSELIWGVCAIVVVLMAFTLRQKAWIADVVYVASGALTAGLASVVWGGSSILIGVLTSVAAALVAALLVWMLRVGVRDPGHVRS